MEWNIGVKMKLKCMTLYALIGLFYFFLMRTIGTLYPIINYNLTWLTIELILNFIAQLAISLFFLALIKEYLPDDDIPLLNITILTFLGSIALLLVNTLNGLSSLLYVSLDHSITGRYLVNMVVWIVGFIMVIFYLYFSQYLCKKPDSVLCKPVMLAFAGSLTAFILHSINMLNYYYHSTRGRIFLDLKNDAMIIPGAILVLFTYFSLIAFMVYFYKNLNKNEI